MTSSIVQSERLFPATKAQVERTVCLSLLDATTVNFTPTSAVWFFERPSIDKEFDLVDHLRRSLRVVLDSHPQWCGRVKAITSLDSTEYTSLFAPHALRFGRAYVHYGTPQDPGVEFIHAASSLTLDALCPSSRPAIWHCDLSSLDALVPSTPLAHAFKLNDAPGLSIQVTQLACGGFALGIKAAHPLADITTIVHLLQDWASVSQRVLSSSTSLPGVSFETPPKFDPSCLDLFATGDINADKPDPAVIQQAHSLPLHRFDWWAQSPGGPKPYIPIAFQGQDIPPAGNPMPWSEWDTEAPVSCYLLHFTCAQAKALLKKVTQTPNSSNIKISQHDAILAHVWACINRARDVQNDGNPLYCNLVWNVRSALGLGDDYMGSPIIMMHAEVNGNDIGEADQNRLLHIQAQRIREAINAVRRPGALGAHLHSLAYEKSPQRIWQAFLGRRYVLATTWARAGVYGVDFGFNPGSSSGIRYVQSVMPSMDGIVEIKEGPPRGNKTSSDGPWIENGVDVSIHICSKDMDRLIQDPLLFP